MPSHSLEKIDESPVVFVKPGAKRILTIGWWGDKIAFVNPDGTIKRVVQTSEGVEPATTP